MLETCASPDTAGFDDRRVTDLNESLRVMLVGLGFQARFQVSAMISDRLSLWRPVDGLRLATALISVAVVVRGDNCARAVARACGRALDGICDEERGPLTPDEEAFFRVLLEYFSPGADYTRPEALRDFLFGGQRLPLHITSQIAAVLLGVQGEAVGASLPMIVDHAFGPG